MSDIQKAELYHLDLAKKTIIRSIKSDSISVFSLPDKIVDSYGDSAWSEAISDIFDNRESYDFTNSELKTLEYLVGIQIWSEGVENCKNRTAKNLINPWYIWYNKVQVNSNYCLEYG